MAASTGKRPVYGPSTSDLSNSTDRSMGDGGGGVLGVNYTPSQMMRTVTLGKTAGITGPTVSGDGYKASAGIGPRGSIGIGGKIAFKKGGDVKGKKKPVKKAAGGAAKVRKGACSPDGKIINAMRKLRGN